MRDEETKESKNAWFSTAKELPEKHPELCGFADDGRTRFTTVLTMDRFGRMEIRNRILVRTTESEYLNAYQPLDTWHWGVGANPFDNDKVLWWLPIPRNKEFKAPADDNELSPK